MDLCEFKASLVYKESSRTARDVTQRNHVSKKQKSRQEFLKLEVDDRNVTRQTQEKNLFSKCRTKSRAVLRHP